MSNFSTRLRLIYAPFLTIAILFIVIYTLLDYLLVIRMELPISEDLVHIWLPFGLPFIPVLIWLRPRIKLLYLRDGKGNIPGLYQFVASVAISVPVLFAQNYMATATGKLTRLEKISDITRQPLTKYFALNHYYIDKRDRQSYARAEVSGKHNEYLTFYIDYACSILDTALKPDSTLQLKFSPGRRWLVILNGQMTDSSINRYAIRKSDVASLKMLNPDQATAIYGASGKNGAIIVTTKKFWSPGGSVGATKIPAAWLGLEYKKELSNNISKEAKEDAYNDFAKATEQAFADSDVSKFVYLDRIGFNDRRRGYMHALARGYTNLPAKPVIFEAVNAPFESRSGNNLGWILKSFGIGGLVWLIMILIPRLKEDQVALLPKNALLADVNQFLKAAQVFSSKSLFQVTAFIAAINILVFLLMVFAGLGFLSFEAPDLVKWGGNIRSLTEGGQWWRLITSTFVHAGLMHLLLNMYGLVFAAIFVEPGLGKIRYALCYLFCGVAASVASIWWHDNTVAVGASGAIFGLYGILVALVTTNRIGLKRKSGLLGASLFFIIVNLLMGISGNIDNAAHIGGLLAGLLIGYALCLFGGLPDKADEQSHQPGDPDTAETQ